VLVVGLFLEIVHFIHLGIDLVSGAFVGVIIGIGLGFGLLFGRILDGDLLIGVGEYEKVYL
jgi:hypothetical protein